MTDSFVGKIITDFKPRVCVRFDDGQSHQVNDIKQFLDDGWRIDLVLNWNTIVTGSNSMSVKDIGSLLRYAELRGTRLMITSHGNFNWSQEATVGAYSDAQIAAELDFTDIVNAVGSENFSYGYVQPGDPGPLAGVQDNAARIEAVMRDLGYKFAYGLYNSKETTGTGLSQTGLFPLGQFVPDSNGVWEPTFNNLNYHPCGYQDPFKLWGPGTFDLGNAVEMCGTFVDTDGDGTADTWVDDYRSGARPLVYEQDAAGIVPAGLDVANDFDTSAQVKLEEHLGWGGDFVIALHGSERNNRNAGFTIDGANFTGYDIMTYEHLRWLLNYYRGEDFITPGNLVDIAERAVGVPAVGVDVVGNPKLRLSQKNFPFVNEMGGVDMDTTENQSVDYQLATVPGWGSSSAANSVYVANVGNLIAPGTVVPGLGRLNKISGLDYRDFNHYDGTGLYWEDEGGTLCPNGVAVCTDIGLSRTGLRPGEYEFSFDWYQEAGGSLVFSQVGVIGMRNYEETYAALNDAPTDASVRKYCILYGNEFDQVAAIDATPKAYRRKFTMPSDAVPQLAPYVYTAAGSVTVNANSSTDLAAETVPGAVVGARVVVLVENPQVGTRHQDPIQLTGRVTAPDTVVVTLSNPSAGNITTNASGPILTVLVEDVAFEQQVRAGQYRPLHPWVYAFRTRIGTDVSRPETQLNNVQLRYLGPA